MLDKRISAFTKFDQRLDSAMRNVQRDCTIITRFFQEPRHVEDIRGIEDPGNFEQERENWQKFARDRMKTSSIAIIMCLHIGIEPPDAPPKPEPCAKLLGWLDPSEASSIRSCQKICQNIQRSYDKWGHRTNFRYKLGCDPSLEDVRKICTTLRRQTGEDRILFHYNGQGVPQPTKNGEIWVFNKSYTQYIPMSLYDLQSWLECPAVFVWESHKAESIITAFRRFADERELEWQKNFDAWQEKHPNRLPSIHSEMTLEEQAEAMGFPQKFPKFKECIHLASCREGQNLPFDEPGLPADLFSACLTAPVQTAIIWHLIRTKRRHLFPVDIMAEVPGHLQDRKTVLGELNWIYTAISDTIAFTVMKRETFQMLFRQDLLLASLFRGFLLSQRILATFDVSPVSIPVLPNTAYSELWQCWDSTLDMVLDYVRELIYIKGNNVVACGRNILTKNSIFSFVTLIDFESYKTMDNSSNWFYEEQLQAFELWLDYVKHDERPPLQLPVVLQVLLSQVHRCRALKLLARFLDFGQWAVGLSLSVGIFPYVQRLLQSNTKELRPWLAFCWAKILAVDPSCQMELFKEMTDDSSFGVSHKSSTASMNSYQGRSSALSGMVTPKRIEGSRRTIDRDNGGSSFGAFPLPSPARPRISNPTPMFVEQYDPTLDAVKPRYTYFVNILNDPNTTPKHKIVPAFVLAMLFHNGNEVAQENLTKRGFVNLCTELLIEPSMARCKLLKLWIMIGLGRLWSEYNPARWQAVRLVAYERVLDELADESPVVRASAVFAIGGLFNNSSVLNEHALAIDQQITDELCKRATFDSSVLVRKELVTALQWYVFDFEERFGRLLIDLVKKCDIKIPQNEEAIDIASTMDTRRVRVQYGEDPNTSIDSTTTAPRRKHSKLPMEEVFANAKKSEGLHGVEVDEDVDECSSFRIRALKQIAYLEMKPFNEPAARTWLALLRLSLDPVLDVAHMAQQIVKRVEMKYDTLKNHFQTHFSRQISYGVQSRSPNESEDLLPFTKSASRLDHMNAGNHVKFEIGSPKPAVRTQAAKYPYDMNQPQSPAISPDMNNISPEVASPPDMTLLDLNRTRDDSDNSAPPNNFEIGSPEYDETPADPSLINHHHLHHNHQPTSPRSAPTPHPADDLDDAHMHHHSRKFSRLQSVPDPKISNLLSDSEEEDIMSAEEVLGLFAKPFTPKRRTTGKGDFSKQSGQSQAKIKALVSTEFVPWCSKVFVEPILHLLYTDNGCDQVIEDDKVLTETSPSDWAVHAHEGLLQTAEDELKAVADNAYDVAICRGVLPHAAVSMVTSKLRKCLYLTDGKKLSIIRKYTDPRSYVVDQTESRFKNYYQKDMVKTFDINEGNPYSPERMSQLILINDMSREMILCCSPMGVVKVWDPCYRSYSEMYEEEPKMISTGFPLGDQTRIGDRTTNCIFDWDQPSGRLVCASSRLIRIWDAHYERPVFDLTFNITNKQNETRIPSSITANLDNNSGLMTVGFSDGSIDIYDTRMPRRRAMRLQSPKSFETSFMTPVIDLALRGKNSGETGVEKLMSINKNGQVTQWEPRMYSDVIWRKELPPSDYYRHASVHRNGRVIASAFGSSFSVYEVDRWKPLLTEKTIGQVRRNESLPAVTALTMHQIKLQTLVAYEDNTISVYSRSDRQ